ncbi:F-box/LRR-repeat protein [Trifolium pratense]|uniref:F-box/LRR-repeat protein n=1 Tax=Trifolium pratense TaxID=57577 RepID=A0A2K3NSY2_TRIPR|nr:F-box/LRR-repeat protein [Trifolium pratense]
MKKIRQCENENDEIKGSEDRLGDLPDCVLLHILSFLNTKHVVQTCVLSTRWRHLWKRIPTLILHCSKFTTKKHFTIFVSKILTLRDPSTALHALDLDRRGDIEPHVLKKILNYVSSNKTHLKELGISIHGDGCLVMSCVSSCHALTSLNLSIYPRVRKVNINDLRQFHALAGHGLVLFSWLLDFANVESLTVTSTTLQILSLVPDLFEVKLPSLCNLKLLEVELIPLYDGSLSQSIEDSMLEKAAAKSCKEVAKLRKAFNAGLVPPAIPDGMVDFLRQNSPSAVVNISTYFPDHFNLKQVEESIKGAKIVKYRSRYAAPGSSSIAPASAPAPSSVSVPASAAPPNLHLCCADKEPLSAIYSSRNCSRMTTEASIFKSVFNLLMINHHMKIRCRSINVTPTLHFLMMGSEEFSSYLTSYNAFSANLSLTMGSEEFPSYLKSVV